MNNRPLLPPGLEVPDALHLHSRRAYMAAVFASNGPYSDEMMAAARAEAEHTICAALHHHNVTRIGHLNFEYLVDLTIWIHFMQPSMQPSMMVLPEIDWSVLEPDREAISPTHSQSSGDQVHSENLSDENTVPSADHGPASGLVANPLPVAASGTSSQISPPLAPPVPSLAIRQHIWTEGCSNLPGWHLICGPFEVRIHLRDAPHLFAGAQELLPPELALSWETEGSTYKLILGFAPGVDHSVMVNEVMLMVNWAVFVEWAALVHSGRHVTLASHLRDLM
ncbi:hypothetical protein Neosp_008976 [[Neocosmospora] mangrovei]